MSLVVLSPSRHRWFRVPADAAIVVMALGVVLVTADDAAAQSAARKAGRGLAALTTGVLEVPGNMYRGGHEGGAEGVAVGFAKGLGMIVPRTLVGVYELLTAPFPVPGGFRPVLEPEFPWGYFDDRPSAGRRRR